jgi:hypothetical protein
MPDRRNSVQRAYDAAVDSDGWPTQRVQDYFTPELAYDTVVLCHQLLGNPEVDKLDALLAMFAAGVIHAQDSADV